MIKISVVMPAYNAEKYIGQAIESILNQTYSNFEFIIINDGSNDKTKEVILSYKDDRIIYLENERNFGIVVTLREMNGENRIDDFIKMCMMRGWIVNRLDVQAQADVYFKAEEEITFE